MNKGLWQIKKRRILQNKNEINVVADQSGSPTYALDLAKFILLAISKKPDFKGTEIYHFTNTGITTWEDFARAIKKKINRIKRFLGLCVGMEKKSLRKIPLI